MQLNTRYLPGRPSNIDCLLRTTKSMSATEMTESRNHPDLNCSTDTCSHSSSPNVKNSNRELTTPKVNMNFRKESLIVARLPCFVIPEQPHHVIQRSNEQKGLTHCCSTFILTITPPARSAGHQVEITIESAPFVCPTG